MLDGDVLDIDASRARRLEQPREFAGLVRDDDLDGRESPRRPAMLTGQAPDSVDPSFQQVGELLSSLLVT